MAVSVRIRRCCRLTHTRPLPPSLSCGLLVFRHVQKTGGSTLRHYFRMQELTGDWEFYSPQGDGRWPETSNRVRTQVLLGFWEALMSPSVNFTETPRRIIMEWHAEAHLVPPWERAVEARPSCLLLAHPPLTPRACPRLSPGCAGRPGCGAAP